MYYLLTLTANWNVASLPPFGIEHTAAVAIRDWKLVASG